MRNPIIAAILCLFLSTIDSVASIPESVYSLSPDGAVLTWLKLGPIPDSAPLSGHDAEYLPNESSLSPELNTSCLINEATYSWTALYYPHSDIRLSDLERPAENVAAYFFCLLESDRDWDLTMQIARDDTAKIWLDGLLIYNNAEPNPDFGQRDEVKISLPKGRLPLLVKIDQDKGFWGFSVRLNDADGKIPEGVSVVLPGQFDEQQYLNSVMTVASPPLVEKSGKQLLRLKLSPFILPQSLESLTVYEADQADAPVWTGASLNKQYITIPVDRKAEQRDVLLRVGIRGRIYEKRVAVKPCRDWRVYLFPGSHVDIGYTNLQEIVMDDHKKFFRQAWDLYEESLQKDYMHDAHYIWNPEVTWVLKDFLRTESDADCKRLLDYLRRGIFSLDALYCNLLTALCGDEELIRSVYYSTHLAEREHLPEVVSAMITDVPGYTWGVVPVLAGAGVKYFNLGPNYNARIGLATKALGGHPYYWIGPDGRTKILVWNTGEGYSNTFNMLRSENGVDQFLQILSQYQEDENYPYDVAQFRAYLVDNTPPPAHLSHMAQEWNQQYLVPRLILSGAPAAFQDLESKYADKIPSHQGDYTPYWEDGAASSARETAMNRTASLRMEEADAAWALARAAGGSAPVPLKELEQGYDNAMLYSEHTWGAHNSISQPDSPFAQHQWRVKRRFAEDSMWLSSQLKRKGLRALSDRIQNATPFTFAVWNLTQWPRSGEAVLARHEEIDPLNAAEQWMAVDSDGNASPVVRNLKGYVFQAENIPPFGYKVYQFLPQSFEDLSSDVSVSVADGTMLGGEWEIKIDSETGGVSSLTHLTDNRQWVDDQSPYRLNQYLHVLGPNGKESRSADQVILRSQFDGFRNSLAAEVGGQGIERLRQEISLYPNQNRIDFTNTMDKSDIRDKEAVRFAFPFQVSGGQFTLEIPLATMHPEVDQIPGANRNIYTLRRWIDVSNQDAGMTLVSHDAPLIELCDMHAEQEWLEHLPLTNMHFYSYVMNNYWFTNYKASQGGPAIFRYSLWMHDGPCKPSESTRFADKATSPLCVVPLRITDPNNAPLPPTAMSLASIDASHILIQNIKWAENGEGVIIRLRELDGASTNAQVKFHLWDNFQWRRCDLVERPIEGESGEANQGVLPIAIRGKEIQTYLILPPGK